MLVVKRLRAILLLAAVSMLLSGCGGGETKVSTTRTTAPAVTYPAYEQVIRDYWAAFNAFNIEKCLSYLEPAYAVSRRPGLESELEEFKKGRMLGVKMVVDSVSPPATMENGQLQVQVTMKITPRGLSNDRYLIYDLVSLDGVWKITRQRDDPDKTPPGREPENLKAETVTVSQVKLTWEDKTSRESGYLVERAADKSFQTSLVSFTLPVNSTSYTDTTVAAGATYYYRVFAFNKAGNSDASNRIDVTIPAA